MEKKAGQTAQIFLLSDFFSGKNFGSLNFVHKNL